MSSTDVTVQMASSAEVQQQHMQQQHMQQPHSNSARDLLMVSLSRFYSQRNHMQRVMPYITCTSGVSLRLIDWFVTNYAKKHNIILPRTQNNNVVHFNVYLSYRAQLKAYSKQQFDPFRRRDRIRFYYERSESVETTLGQLNFFRWMLQNGVLDYVVEYAPDIERDMLQGGSSGKLSAGATSAASAPSSAGAVRDARVASPDRTAAATTAPSATKARGSAAGGGQQQQQQHAASRRKRCELSQCKATRNMTRVVGPRTVAFD